MKVFGVLISAMIAVLLFGCGGGDGDAVVSEADSVSEITEAQTRARLRVEVEKTEIDLTGVVPVRVTMLWDEGVSVELIEPDWKEAGWAYVTERAGEIRFDGVVYSQMIDFELEPFLGGEYVVPSIGIRAESEDVGRRIARLQPVGIVVESALDEADGRDLDPAVGLATMFAADDEANVNWGIWGGLGVAIVSGVVIVMMRMRMRGNGEGLGSIDPEAVLVVAAGSEKLSEEDLGALHRALVVLSSEHGSLRSISHEIERERFSGDAVNHQRVRAAAQRAAEVCGVGL